MLGERFAGDLGVGASQRGPSSYMMSSKMDAQAQMHTSIYDDTGRGH